MITNELVVLKHGSATVENDNQIGLDQAKINLHVDQHMRLREQGFDTVEVASGAVVAGREYAIHEWGLEGVDVEFNQLALFGSARQFRQWEEAGYDYGLVVGQMLLSHQAIDDTDSPMFWPPAATIADGIFEAHPRSLMVVNENHAVASEEIRAYNNSLIAKFNGDHNPEADNDWLAAHLSIALGAKVLLLLTNVDGLKIDGKVVSELSVDEIPEALPHCQGKSWAGKGGMESKLRASGKAAEAGVEVIIGNAFTDVRELMDGEAGTRVVQ